MKTSISTKMIAALERAMKRLTPEMRAKLTAYVLSQQSDSGAFVNKGGKDGLYDTVFGWIVLYALGVRLDSHKMSSYLSQFNPEELDLVHYIAYMKSKSLYRLVSEGVIGMWLNVWSVGNVRSLDSFKEYPFGDRHTPYNQFFWLSLLEDNNARLIGKKQTLIDLEDYKVPGGGYSVQQHQDTVSTNATATALMIKAQLAAYDHDDAQALRKMQEKDGGFKSEVTSPVADLHSTATALFALKNYGLKPLVDPTAFIQAHLTPNNGFVLTKLVDQGDMEDTFYGLMALGSI